VAPRASIPILAVLTGLGAIILTGCEGRSPPVTGEEAASAPAAADYVAPPTVRAVQATAAGLTLSGVAPPGARVRLATPQGQAFAVAADPAGRWSLALGVLDAPRVYGLSAIVRGRLAQSQGYVLVTPQGRAAVLRSGAAAWRIDRPPGVGLRTIDFDREGAAVVSAAVAPGAAVVVRLEGREAAQGRADRAGRFEGALPTPLQPGAHRLELSGEGFDEAVTVQVSPPAPLAQGPLRSQFTALGLRADWMTPGGGVQSTILVH
jgi:hypothetical protein